MKQIKKKKSFTVCLINDDVRWSKTKMQVLNNTGAKIYTRKDIQSILKNDVSCDLYFIDIGGLGLIGLFNAPKHIVNANYDAWIERYQNYLRPFKLFVERHPNSRFILNSGLMQYAKDVAKDLQKDNPNTDITCCDLGDIWDIVEKEMKAKK